MMLNRKWLALIILCLGDLMIVLDTTIVNVALPSIRTSLGFSEVSLVWVVNAYMLTFSGFLLLGGRLGDLYGHRKLFLIGLSVFTAASLLCGIAQSQFVLIAARAIQGLGGAIVAAIALSLIMDLFTEEKERARAMGIIGFISAGGGAIGVVLGGVLTGAFDWHWNFLVNVPIGLLVFILGLKLIPTERKQLASPHLDIVGAITVTSALMLAVYGIVGGDKAGWISTQTIGLLAAAVVLMGVFLYVESSVRAPLMPLSLFKLRSVAIANIVGILWSAGMFAWFFISALYMQIILHYTPLQVGLAFLPANVIMAIFSLGLSAYIVTRFGFRAPLSIGMALVCCGLAFFARAPEAGSFVIDVLPSMVLLGFGAGMAFNPVLLAGMSEVPHDESGLASGVLNTAFMMGGSLGLAILASIAAYATHSLRLTGSSETVSLLSGYHEAFIAGAICTLAASVIAFTLLPKKSLSSHALSSHGSHV
jgi:EmrB/QacA subfamily drug resistance transporter